MPDRDAVLLGEFVERPAAAREAARGDRVPGDEADAFVLAVLQRGFTLSVRDISPNLRLSLDILSYSGTLLSKGTVKIANQKTGQRYVVNVALQ